MHRSLLFIRRYRCTHQILGNFLSRARFLFQILVSLEPLTKHHKMTRSVGNDNEFNDHCIFSNPAHLVPRMNLLGGGFRFSKYLID